MKHEETRWGAALALLRGLVLLLAGLFALVVPSTALTMVVVVGGCLLIVDGLLGLASQNFGVGRAWPFWLNLTRNVLAIVMGMALVASPLLAGIVSLGLLATIVGLQAVVVGLIEIVVVLRNRSLHPSTWSAITAAALYICLGLLLWFIPMAGALLLVQVGGALVVLFAVLHLMQTWAGLRNATGLRPLA